MIKLILIIWGLVNLISIAIMLGEDIEFGNKGDFSLKDKTLLDLICQYIILMPIEIINIIVLIFNWIPFKETNKDSINKRL